MNEDELTQMLFEHLMGREMTQRNNGEMQKH